MPLYDISSQLCPKEINLLLQENDSKQIAKKIGPVKSCKKNYFKKIYTILFIYH
jgi:hypothetical protein